MAARVLFDAVVPTGAGSTVELDARRSHHLLRVLRLAVGDPVEAFDGHGRSFAATVEVADPRRCLLRLDSTLDRDVESPLSITLGQCLSTADKMDWTIEKAVELGVRAIVPLSSARSQVRLDAARSARKLEHWQHIVESACTQSGRSLLPRLAAPRPLAEFLDDDGWPGEAPRKFVLDPRANRALSVAIVAAADPADPADAAAGPGLGAAAAARRTIVLLVGPESGFAEDELRAAHAAGFEPVTIGRRILRTETAGLAAIAVLQALAGDF